MGQQAKEGTFWLGHVSGIAATIAAHAVLAVMLVAFHGSAGGATSPSAALPPPPPSVQARLVKLGRPENVRRQRADTVVATSPETGIALSKTNEAETKVRPQKTPQKNAAVDDALLKTLRRAEQLGQQGSPETGPGSPDGVEGGEIDAAEAREIDLYVSMLQRLFRQNFRVPATSDSGLRCRVRVPINRDLSVGTPVVAQSSGDPTFDQSALAAARAVNTVPPPPPEIADQVLGRPISVNYRGSSN
jgi:TonB family protein